VAEEFFFGGEMDRFLAALNAMTVRRMDFDVDIFDPNQRHALEDDLDILEREAIEVPGFKFDRKKWERGRRTRQKDNWNAEPVTCSKNAMQNVPLSGLLACARPGGINGEGDDEKGIIAGAMRRRIASESLIDPILPEVVMFYKDGNMTRWAIKYDKYFYELMHEWSWAQTLLYPE